MIIKPTLFILGAGASIPYGYPSGATLRNQICEGSRGVSTELARNISTSFDFSAVDVMEFAREFQQSRIASIDSFLAKRPEYSDLGKAAIATLLIPHENDSVFDEVDADEDWYFQLWNALVAGVHSLEELALNQVRVLTFNYDRSLERYLHLAIKHTFNVSDEVALDALGYFKIEHVYGSLGQFGLSDANQTRTYRGKINAIHLNIAVSSIRVIPEARDNDQVFTNAKDAFSWAKHVCLLGFGFDQLNVERLGFRDIVLSANELVVPSKIVASVYGKTKAQQMIAKNSLIGDMQFAGKDGASKPIWHTNYGTNLDTLRNYAWLLEG